MREAKAGEETSRRSLRILGSVGEPINPEAWLWTIASLANTLSIVDTWWQTRNRRHLDQSTARATPTKQARPHGGAWCEADHCRRRRPRRMARVKAICGRGLLAGQMRTGVR